MHRREIITAQVDKNKYRSYLELGLRDPDSVFNHIPCNIKHSVDLNLKSSTYNMSTDDFFKLLEEGKLDLDRDYKWDVIFIDANHLADFVKNDIINSLNHLSSGGMIFLHDVLPPTYNSQLEDRQCQTAWKSVPYLLKHHPEVHVCTIPEHDGGVGIVVKNHSKERHVLDSAFNPFYEYYIMDSDRKSSQNFIDYSELEQWLVSPYYNFSSQDIKRYENVAQVKHLWK